MTIKLIPVFAACILSAQQMPVPIRPPEVQDAMKMERVEALLKAEPSMITERKHSEEVNKRLCQEGLLGALSQTKALDAYINDVSAGKSPDLKLLKEAAGRMSRFAKQVKRFCE